MRSDWLSNDIYGDDDDDYDENDSNEQRHKKRRSHKKCHQEEDDDDDGDNAVSKYKVLRKNEFMVTNELIIMTMQFGNI